MEIRKIVPSDKSELLKIMVEFYSSPALLHHTPETTLSKVIDDCVSDLPYIDGYVCVDGGIIAGYTMLSVGYSTEYGGISVMIEDIYIRPELRGKGVGSAFLRFIENAYRDTAVRLRLEVEQNNTNAIEVYKRNGYSEIAYKQMGKLL